MELCLGTVQLGLQYGIAKDKQPSFSEAVDILEYAFDNNINTFDTANSYGDAEKILGFFLKNHQQNRKNITVITKTTTHSLENCLSSHYPDILKKDLLNSLTKLQTDYIDVFLFHTSASAFDEKKLAALNSLKKEGLIKHCGISVYYPDEALAAIKSGYIDFIQLPFNLFDQRFYHQNIFNLAQKNNIIIHARSAFLQGLFSIPLQNIPPNLSIAIPSLRELDNICQQNDISKLELALAFIKHFPAIANIVIGVNSIKQLKINLQLFKKTIPFSLTEKILITFKNLNEKIYLPTLWNKMD